MAPDEGRYSTPFLVIILRAFQFVGERDGGGALRVTVVTDGNGNRRAEEQLDVSHHVQGSQVESASGGTSLLFISGRYSSTDGNDSVF